MKKLLKFIPTQSDANSRRSWFWSLFPLAALLCLFFFLGSAFLAQDQKEPSWHTTFPFSFHLRNNLHSEDYLDGRSGEKNHFIASAMSARRRQKNRSIATARPPGSESLPEGIVCNASNLEMLPLWGLPKNKGKHLFTVPVGIKQKQMVDRMVRKFLSSNFSVMLFHYDGFVDGWKDLAWSDLVIHVSAVNQTKWWFAKRFLHPDIVAEYDYVFLWDEDLGVDDFHPERYLQIVKEEGLEISQPALDPMKSELHHLITTRGKRMKVHRRIYKPSNGTEGCNANSKAPPCTGWIELMAPVFSRTAWRCSWYMIQNDLIHAWGLDMQLGYCAQGDRTKNVGVVDSEYIIHYGLPTLGENAKKINLTADENTTGSNSIPKAMSNTHTIDYRIEVRRQSYRELKLFKSRWAKASKEDVCWVDPYPNV